MEEQDDNRIYEREDREKLKEALTFKRGEKSRMRAFKLANTGINFMDFTEKT